MKSLPCLVGFNVGRACLDLDIAFGPIRRVFHLRMVAFGHIQLSSEIEFRTDIKQCRFEQQYHTNGRFQILERAVFETPPTRNGHVDPPRGGSTEPFLREVPREMAKKGFRVDPWTG
jgi:hypothetical protein